VERPSESILLDLEIVTWGCRVGEGSSARLILGSEYDFSVLTATGEAWQSPGLTDHGLECISALESGLIVRGDIHGRIVTQEVTFDPWGVRPWSVRELK
jgi:hypothetical protein